MEKEFCTYSQALRLKALGFNEPCFAFFNGKHLDFNIWDWEYSAGQKRRDIGECPLAPTFQEAFRWFREKHNLHCAVNTHTSSTNQLTYICSLEFGKKLTYEEAELACLNRLLEIVESKSE